jgi:hypothetical protein
MKPFQVTQMLDFRKTHGVLLTLVKLIVEGIAPIALVSLVSHTYSRLPGRNDHHYSMPVVESGNAQYAKRSSLRFVKVHLVGSYPIIVFHLSRDISWRNV